MTLEEANEKVETTMDAREDAIHNVLTACPAHLIDALVELEEKQDAYFDALQVWGELDDAAKK